jgi:HEAT repeat protein
MGVASDAATATYNQLLNDADPRVRAQAEQALARTGGVNPVQPVGGVNRY